MTAKTKASRLPHGTRLVLRDNHRRPRASTVIFRDTLLLAPGGSGLSAVGEAIGIPKLKIPKPYSISRMDEYLASDRAGFESYALRDAEISAEYYLRMAQFAKDELGLDECPSTLGGMALRAFAESLAEAGFEQAKIFGTQVVKEKYWSEARNQAMTRSQRVPTPTREFHEGHFTRCFSGGRPECFYSGPTDVGEWNDFDISGAYTTGLCDQLPLEYSHAYLAKNPQAYTGHVCGAARVRFSFPKCTRFPSLPERTQYGLIYPLTGESYCTAPEIAVALVQGADVTILEGVIVPWVAGSKPFFEPFMRKVRRKRSQYPKGSFDDRVWKGIGNSAYGKLGQGLASKSAFNTRSGSSSPIGHSSITNPYYASHATGFVRAVVSEMLASIPGYRTVISVTTDGILSNATRDEIDLTGPICSRFNTLCERLEGKV